MGIQKLLKDGSYPLIGKQRVAQTGSITGTSVVTALEVIGKSGVINKITHNRDNTGGGENHFKIFITIDNKPREEFVSVLVNTNSNASNAIAFPFGTGNIDIPIRFESFCKIEVQKTGTQGSTDCVVTYRLEPGIA